ncbi:carbohydrate ABC transporter permease [Saccharibacillus sp. CPCC 101409]|uniref:carbohydrate ABC transporter permease n=1 Tax=Saccharibacillus sp. CPCC 101409 TaxID=3058041 RepID=UPI002670E881|nr:carbohydrate ABC transporter permease [Saccharibacillus sp. CPCC 101409]MDO3412124.1 carbohydrate ABC transporter permease [Saccharibacillus sp. CPCC 101409]
MEQESRYRIQTLILEILLVLVGLLFLVPFYFLLSNSLKTFGEILSDSASLPSSIQWANYKAGWEAINFPSAFKNSLIITIASNLLLVLFSSMTAYQMVRRDSLYNRLLFGVFVAAMVIPFQSIMLPLMDVTSRTGFSDSLWGLVICYIGFGAPLSVFLFHGSMKSIPLEIEQAARVDGSGTYGVFFRIVYPMMRPMFVTVIILNTLWIWNDYLLPSLVLTSESLQTIPIATYMLFGQYTKQWDLALPALVLGIAPVIVFFLAMQKYIVSGIAAGAVKG